MIFPESSIPQKGFIRRYIDCCYPNSEAHIQYHFAAAISSICATLGRNIWYQNGIHTLYPNLYILVIGESGVSRKSSSVRPAINLINRVDPRVMMSSSFSSESLVANFNLHNNRLLFLDEFRTLVDLNSKSYGAGVISKLTELHSCPHKISSEFKKDYDKDGKIKDDSVAINPCLNILALTTLDWLQLGECDVTGGFLGRFIPIISKGGFNKLVPNPTHDVSQHNELLVALKRLSHRKGELKFDDEALPLWVELYTKYMTMLSNTTNYKFATFGSRIGDILIKFSMIVQLSIDEQSKVIGIEALQFSNKIVEYLSSTYMYLLDNMSFDKQQQAENNMIRLMRTHNGLIGRSDMMRKMKMSVNSLNDMVNTASSKELIDYIKLDTNSKPKIVYYLTSIYAKNSTGLVRILDGSHLKPSDLQVLLER